MTNILEHSGTSRVKRARTTPPPPTIQFIVESLMLAKVSGEFLESKGFAVLPPRRLPTSVPVFHDGVPMILFIEPQLRGGPFGWLASLALQYPTTQVFALTSCTERLILKSLTTVGLRGLVSTHDDASILTEAANRRPTDAPFISPVIEALLARPGASVGPDTHLRTWRDAPSPRLDLEFPDWVSRLGLLTSRAPISECLAEVALLLHAGLSLTATASRLGISYHTVRGRVRRLHAATGTKSSTQLIIFIERLLVHGHLDPR